MVRNGHEIFRGPLDCDWTDHFYTMVGNKCPAAVIQKALEAEEEEVEEGERVIVSVTYEIARESELRKKRGTPLTEARTENGGFWHPFIEEKRRVIIGRVQPEWREVAEHLVTWADLKGDPVYVESRVIHVLNELDALPGDEVEIAITVRRPAKPNDMTNSSD